MKNKRTDALLAVLPLIDFKYQKQMAAAIKFMELRDVLRHYDAVAAQSRHDANWRQNVIKAMIPQMSEQNQKMMNQAVQVMEMQTMLENMREV